MSSHAGGVQGDCELASDVVAPGSVSLTNGAGPLALGRLDSETTSGSCSVERPSHDDCSPSWCERRVRQCGRTWQQRARRARAFDDARRFVVSAGPATGYWFDAAGASAWSAALPRTSRRGTAGAGGTGGVHGTVVLCSARCAWSKGLTAPGRFLRG